MIFPIDTEYGCYMYNNKTGLITKNDKPITIDSKFIGPKVNNKNLKIILGRSCNGKCSYCMQGNHSEQITKPTLEEYHKFIINLLELIDKEHYTSITFFGGEPLLYWNQLQDITIQLKNKNLELGIITNGILMDMNKAKFILDNNITFCLSHDGPGQYQRDKDPLESGTENRNAIDFLYNQKHHMSFNSVFTKNNYNLSEIVEYFDRLGFLDIFIGELEPYVPSGNLDEQFLITQDISNEFTKNIINAIIKYGMQRFACDHDFKLIINQHLNACKGIYPDIRTHCPVTRHHHTAIDLYGNSYACHNVKHNEQIGQYVKNNRGNINQNTFYDQHIVSWGIRDIDCDDCIVRLLCRACPIKPYNLHKRECIGQKAYHLGTLMASLIYFLNSNNSNNI